MLLIGALDAFDWTPLVINASLISQCMTIGLRPAGTDREWVEDKYIFDDGQFR